MNSGKGKVVLVAGGTGAIGSAIARRFLSEGYRVAVSTTETKHAQMFPPAVRSKILTLPANLLNERSVSHLFDSILARWKRIDVVVNTVGGYRPAMPFEKLTLHDWEEMLQKNLQTCFLCTREAVRRMKPRRSGVIVNFSANSALAPAPERIPYAVSKMGIVTLTKSLAAELRGSGISVFAVAPGTVNTRANRQWGSPGEVKKWVTPDEIAHTVLFLSGGMSESASGAVISMADRG